MGNRQHHSVRVEGRSLLEILLQISPFNMHIALGNLGTLVHMIYRAKNIFGKCAPPHYIKLYGNIGVSHLSLHVISS